MESTPVQLTRMEGILNLVLERTSLLAIRVDRSEERLTLVEATTQRLDIEAVARDKTALALAAGIKDAKDTADATTAGEAQKEATKIALKDQAFSPAIKLAALFGSVATVGGLILAFYMAVKK